MRRRLAIALLFGAVFCVRHAPVAPRPAAVACLDEPPPVPPGFTMVRGGEGRCDPAFTFCLTPQTALRMGAMLSDQREWMERAWSHCGDAAAQR